MYKDKLTRAIDWLGQRVVRNDFNEEGTVVEVGGQIKVRWDSGRTSYFPRDKPRNVRLKEPE